MDGSTTVGTAPGFSPTSTLPAVYTSTLEVANASGPLFTGTLDGVAVVADYAFSGDARWRLDPEVSNSTDFLEYDNIPAANAIRLVPRLDVGNPNATLDVTISFAAPIPHLRMYLFWLDFSKLQFTDSNSISFNTTYGEFAYDAATRTISDFDPLTGDFPPLPGLLGGGVGAEIDFTNGAPTSEIRFRITDNSPTMTTEHDSIQHGFARIPEPSVWLLGLAGGLIALGRRRR